MVSRWRKSDNREEASFAICRALGKAEELPKEENRDTTTYGHNTMQVQRP